jgi:Fis family transcriptional regulator
VTKTKACPQHLESELTMDTPVEVMPSESNALGNANASNETSKRLSALSRRGIHIEDADLITRLDQYSIEDVVELKISRFFDQIGTFYPEDVYDLLMSKVEKPLLIQILRRVGGNQVQAAKILGINRNTLRKKIKQYGL